MRSNHAPGALSFVALGIAVVTLAPVRPAAANGPSLDGVSGLLRVHSAELQPQGWIGGTVWGQYTRAVYMPSQSPRARAETIKFGDAGVSIAYVPSPFVELALRGTAQGQFLKSYAANASESELGMSGLALGVKALLTPAAQQDFRLAAELDLATTTGSSNALAGSWDADGFDVGGRLAFTYARPAQDAVPMRAHANAGYVKRTGDFDPAAWAVTAAGPNPPRATLHGDEFVYGLGVEVSAPRGWTAFAEWSGEYDVDADASLTDNPMRITPGARWSAPGGAVLVTSGVDVSLGSDESGPPWGLVAAVTLGGRMTPSMGTLLGMVRDAETGEPVANAQIVARNGKTQTSTDATGHFRAEVDEGYAVLEITAPGYTPKTRVVEVPGRRSVEFDFTIAKHVEYGTVNGRMVDVATGKPLAGRVRLQGATEWTRVDPATGEFRLENVPAGIAVLEADAAHHRAAQASVRVSAGDVVVQEFTLDADSSAPFGVLAGTVRDAASGQPLAATVTLRGKGTKTTITNPATGQYEIELDSGTWEVSVAGTGHAAQADTVQIATNGTRTADYTLAALPREIPVQAVMFDAGTATIKRESFAALEQAAKFLTENPSLKVVIVGHADDGAAAEANVALSQRRADAVLKYLVVNHGVDPLRLTAKGQGAEKPGAVKGAATPTRRIEFLIGGTTE